MQSIHQPICPIKFQKTVVGFKMIPFSFIPVPLQEWDQLEFFAGFGNLTKQARSCGYRAARFDLVDNEQPKNRKSNFMDLTSASGFALLGETCEVHSFVSYLSQCMF